MFVMLDGDAARSLATGPRSAAAGGRTAAAVGGRTVWCRRWGVNLGRAGLGRRGPRRWCRRPGLDSRQTERPPLVQAGELFEPGSDG